MNSFRIYNAHPRKLSTNDCTKRSIALTTGIPYEAVAKGLNEHKKMTGVKLFYNNPNPKSYMENVLHFSNVAMPKGSKITVGEFARSHPVGRFVLSVSEHWTACIDSVVYDTWDCTDRVVLSYYEITRYDRIKVEKKYCFTVDFDMPFVVLVTVYDGNGMHSTKRLLTAEANKYIDELYERGFFNFDEMGEYI